MKKFRATFKYEGGTTVSEILNGDYEDGDQAKVAAEKKAKQRGCKLLKAVQIPKGEGG